MGIKRKWPVTGIERFIEIKLSVSHHEKEKVPHYICVCVCVWTHSVHLKQNKTELSHTGFSPTLVTKNWLYIKTTKSNKNSMSFLVSQMFDPSTAYKGGC